MDENLDKLLNPIWRLLRSVLFDQGTSLLHSLRVVLSDIIVDPSEVSIGGLRRIGLLKSLQPFRDHAIAE
jgi:hypothetical protein